MNTKFIGNTYSKILIFPFKLALVLNFLSENRSCAFVLIIIKLKILKSNTNLISSQIKNLYFKTEVLK